MTGKTTGKKSTLDAIAILTEDHKNVQLMFKEFEKMKEKQNSDNDAKQMLVELACTELTIHAQIEEEIFYPAVRDAIDDDDMLDEAEVEHASARQMIAELESMQPGDDLYDAKFKVLGEYVQHHIKEEQEQMFVKAKKATLDMVALGEELYQRREELRVEFGLQDEDDGARAGSDGSKSKGSGRNVHP